MGDEEVRNGQRKEVPTGICRNCYVGCCFMQWVRHRTHSYRHAYPNSRTYPCAHAHQTANN